MEKKGAPMKKLSHRLVFCVLAVVLCSSGMAVANDRPVPISPTPDGLYTIMNGITVDATLDSDYIEKAQKNYSVFTNTATASFFFNLIKPPVDQSVGLYDARDPSKKAEVYSGSESAGDTATVTFLSTGDVIKNNQNQIGKFSLPIKVGLYVETSGVTVYSQDILNPGASPRVLVFQGEDTTYNGRIQIPTYNPGSWFDSDLIFAFEDGGDYTFDDVVFIVQSILPTFPPQNCDLTLQAGCVVVEPPPGSGCKGKVTNLKVEYTGDDCSATSHSQESSKVSCQDFGALPDPAYFWVSNKGNPDDDRAKVWFEGTVPLNGTLEIDPANAGSSNLSADTWVLIYDHQGGTLLQKVKFHTSCSQPLNIFDQFGSIKIVEITSVDGGTVTPPDPTPPTPQPSCTIVKGSGDVCDGSKVWVLQMAYTAQDCSATSHSQEPGKASCQDLGGLLDTVFIQASDKENPDDSRAKVWFQGSVDLDEVIEIAAANGGASELKADTWIHIFDAPGGDLLQKVKYHTSCSQPIVLGDQVGSMQVAGVILTDGSSPAAGTEVVFTYEVTNTGPVTATNIVVTDIYGAVPGSPIASLDPGESVKLERMVLISDSTVNMVTAMGDPGCQAADTVEITVEEPPPPPPAESCADGKPMVLTMELTGDDCSATSHTQDPTKVSCQDLGAFPASVYIRASDKENPDDGKAKNWFDGAVAVNGTFDIDAGNAGTSRLSANTWVLIYDHQGGTLLQKVLFHTSCSQPLKVGDQFGSLLIVGYTPEP